MLRRISTIWRSYRNTNLRTRIFVLIRGLVCPWDKIMKNIETGDSILDIGCGHGLLLNLFRERYPEKRCAGFDHDKDKIDIARSTSGAIDFMLNDEINRIEGERFDLVTIIDVLYSVPFEEWKDIFSTAIGKLSEDGTLVIKETVNTPKWKYWICLLQEFVAIKVLGYTKGSSPFLGSIDFYLSKIEENGFIVKDHIRVDRGFPWPHYLFVCSKS
ncbi:MAG: methyltransferase domain-containing protein [Nitrospirota bacterium]|nr:MAG: methyltransferase domain-containing protein [Nitrospirota bacterium]